MFTIQCEGLAVPVTKHLCEYLMALLNPEHQGCQAITINFKDPDYSCELGGYAHIQSSRLRSVSEQLGDFVLPPKLIEKEICHGQT
jgi:hypothetical protein